ncbi:SH3 domain-containing protein [Kutzneria sp. CA-103260]|uniref:SH3 domain-containing protein n=1 Tax=Kutzneria sp. CA-103260 TaxID=2802641 RepID=UPI003FA5DFF7
MNIRSGPGTDCTSKGLGYIGHNVTVYCGDVSNWDYLTDNTTGVTGWASNDLVDWNTGSAPSC